MMVLVLAVSACGNRADHDRFEKLASRANPVIKKLQPSAAIVLDPAGTDVKALRQACRQGIADAAPLSTAGFNDRMNDSEQVGVDDVMYTFSQQLELMCQEDEGDGSRDARCKSWCTKRFAELSDAIARVRDRAAKEHVAIEPLLRK